MKLKTIKTMAIALAVIILVMAGVGVAGVISAQAADNTEAAATTEASAEASVGINDILGKAIGAGIAVGFAACGGGIGMGIAVGRCGEGVARQPEMSGKIQTIMMLGLVFIETVVIYALIIAILAIFVL